MLNIVKFMLFLIYFLINDEDKIIFTKNVQVVTNQIIKTVQLVLVHDKMSQIN